MLNKQLEYDYQNDSINGISMHLADELINSPMHHEDAYTHKNLNEYRTISRGNRRESFENMIRSSIASVEEFQQDTIVPNMWSKHYIGLYCQYAAIGLLYGTGGALVSLCVYAYDGSPNLCANASSITFFAWSFKIVFAILTDIYRPFGLRRKPWMIFGWCGVLLILFILAIVAHKLSASVWLIFLMLIQFFAMFSDVPADGYSVELGQLESKEQRGVILATGQVIRFSFCIIAGTIQATLLNGPTTTSSDCGISFDSCWSFGLNVNQYYALLFVLTFIIVIPIFWLKEIDPSRIPVHSLSHFVGEIWETLQNLTTLYLLIFVIGTGCLTNFTSIVNIYMQYYIIELTNFQAGIDTITTYLALSVAIWIFKTYLINRSWRQTQYGSTIIASTLGFLWILVYYNIGGLQNAWFTIFVDLDQAFVQGITQVLFSMAVIELSRPGLEATTYELLITVANASSTLKLIIATQFLAPLKTTGCTDDYGDCPGDSVSVTSPQAFNDSNGPHRYTVYCVTITLISICCCFIFTQFLPDSKDQCQEWKIEGEKSGASKSRGLAATGVSICVIAVSYLTHYVCN